MLHSDSCLCLDLGAANLKAAEFDLTEDGSLRLKGYALQPLRAAVLQDEPRSAALVEAWQDLAPGCKWKAQPASVCVPSLQTFTKILRLPPVDTAKVAQIIQYEAQQCVPFPLAEAVWDYQITGTTPTGDLEVFLAAIKSDAVEDLCRTAELAGLQLQWADTAAAALANAFRFNYPELEGCTLLLDMGARTTNILFFEKGRCSSRSLNLGAHAITVAFATEARLSEPEAERFKIEEGFVSLGGAYEEPVNSQQAQVAKIARQVMTRLHVQVLQTIQFYRSQQGGAAPRRLLLAGGASLMPFTAQFFSEKLSLPVEYFNPLRKLQVDPGVNLEDLAPVAHCLGEVVGLGLRSVARCPLELNLLPRTIRQRQQLTQKRPYLLATVVSVALALWVMGWCYDAKVVAPKLDRIKRLEAQLAPLKELRDRTLNPELREIDRLKKDADQLGAWLRERTEWITILTHLRGALMATEASAEARLAVKRADAGVWIHRLAPDLPEEADTALATPALKPENRWAWDFLQRYHLPLPGPEVPNPVPANATHELAWVNLELEAVNLRRVAPSANRRLMSDLRAQLRSRSDRFSKDTDLADPYTPPTDSDDLFHFGLDLKLAQPIKL